MSELGPYERMTTQQKREYLRRRTAPQPRPPDGETTACSHEECQWEPLQGKADYPWVCVSCRARIDPPENALLVYPDVIERLRADYDTLARELAAAQEEARLQRAEATQMRAYALRTEQALSAAQEREGALRAAYQHKNATTWPYRCWGCDADTEAMELHKEMCISIALAEALRPDAREPAP